MKYSRVPELCLPRTGAILERLSSIYWNDDMPSWNDAPSQVQGSVRGLMGRSAWNSNSRFFNLCVLKNIRSSVELRASEKEKEPLKEKKSCQHTGNFCVCNPWVWFHLFFSFLLRIHKDVMHWSSVVSDSIHREDSSGYLLKPPHVLGLAEWIMNVCLCVVLKTVSLASDPFLNCVAISGRESRCAHWDYSPCCLFYF